MESEPLIATPEQPRIEQPRPKSTVRTTVTTTTETTITTIRKPVLETPTTVNALDSPRSSKPLVVTEKFQCASLDRYINRLTRLAESVVGLEDLPQFRRIPGIAALHELVVSARSKSGIFDPNLRQGTDPVTELNLEPLHESKRIVDSLLEETQLPLRDYNQAALDAIAQSDDDGTIASSQYTNAAKLDDDLQAQLQPLDVAAEVTRLTESNEHDQQKSAEEIARENDAQLELELAAATAATTAESPNNSATLVSNGNDAVQDLWQSALDMDAKLNEEEAVVAQFQDLDTNGSGFLEGAQLQALESWIQMEHGDSSVGRNFRRQFRAKLATVTHSSDMKLSFDEFKRWWNNAQLQHDQASAVNQQAQVPAQEASSGNGEHRDPATAVPVASEQAPGRASSDDDDNSIDDVSHQSENGASSNPEPNQFDIEPTLYAAANEPTEATEPVVQPRHNEQPMANVTHEEPSQNIDDNLGTVEVSKNDTEPRGVAREGSVDAAQDQSDELDNDAPTASRVQAVDDDVASFSAASNLENIASPIRPATNSDDVEDVHIIATPHAPSSRDEAERPGNGVDTGVPTGDEIAEAIDDEVWTTDPYRTEAEGLEEEAGLLSLDLQDSLQPLQPLDESLLAATAAETSRTGAILPGYGIDATEEEIAPISADEELSFDEDSDSSIGEFLDAQYAEKADTQ